MARRFAKVSEEEIEEAFFYPSDLVNTKTTIPLRVGEERWIYTSTLRFSVYIHHYSPPLRGIVVYYCFICTRLVTNTAGSNESVDEITSACAIATQALETIGSLQCRDIRNWKLPFNVPLETKRCPRSVERKLVNDEASIL